MKLLSIYATIFLFILSCQAKNEDVNHNESETVQLDSEEFVPPPLPDSFAAIQAEQMPLKASRQPKDLEEQILELTEPPSQQQTQKLIRRAEVRMQVEDYEESSQTIMETLKRHQAFVTDGTEERAGENLENTLQIKVGNNDFDKLLKELTAESIYLERKNISVSDVTEEYIDNAARLKTKKRVELRYLDLLQKAKNVKEILQIEEQLSTLREEIEATEAKQIYINRQVEFCTIELIYYEKVAATTSPDNSFSSQLIASLKIGWSGIGRMALTLVSIWPLVLISLLSGLWLLKYIRRRKLQTT